jgi:hypothetical protein|tara:strand:+ start:3234 stop:3425 length:192 start_codon:yes stop_codon:yes gene_type:complete
MHNLKPLVNDKALWESFLEELQLRLNDVHKQMEQAPDANDLYRLQGQAAALNKFKFLRDKVNG